MESRIPVPTDNIYKFYALFSLLVLVFSMSAILYVNQTTNSLLLSSLVELETLKTTPGPPALAVAKKSFIDKRAELAVSDKKFYSNVLAVFSGLALCGIYYSFRKWHHDVQPVIDQTAIVQLEIAKLQLEKLRRENPATPAGGGGEAEP